MGVPVNAATGNPEGSSPEVLQFNNNFMPAQATSEIDYQANLPATPSVGLLDPNDFEANPLFGASPAAQITGTGANLSPDAPAVGTGMVTTPLTDATTLTAGQAITVSDGTNTDTFTPVAGPPASTVQDLLNYINNVGSAAVSASLSPNGQIVLTTTGANADTSTITVGGAGAAAIGFGAGANIFTPTNLLTQNPVLQGQTLAVTVTNNGIPTTQTITFGTNTGAGQVETLAQLQTALQSLNNVTGSVDPSDGDITVTASGANADTETISLGGSTASLATFGIQNADAYPANGTVIGNDVSTFTNESVDGGSITAYDSQGNPVNVDFRWAKTNSAASGGTDSWQLFYQTNTSATGTQAAWQNVNQSFTFNSSGQLTSPSSAAIPLPNLTVNGDSLGNVTLNLGTNGLTQFASSSGSAQVNEVQQNGFAAGQMQSISVDSQGQVAGSFSNGQTIPLAQITLATFSAENSLQPLDGEAYAATPESGSPNYSATGTIVGGSLEASNVDIATQFSQLIVAQQAYSANAKVMSTADQMIQSLLTVIQ